MAIGVYFHPESLTAAQHDDVIRRLDAAGAGHPAGRQLHVSFGSGHHLSIFEIWDSAAEMQAFGPTLMPILAAAGINPGEPSVEPVHNAILDQPSHVR